MKPDSEAEAAIHVERPKRSRVWIAVAIGVPILAALIGGWVLDARYGAGRELGLVQGSLDASEEERDDLQGRVEALEQTVAEQEARLALLGARADIARAVDALDDRNFGIARGALERAAEGLRDRGERPGAIGAAAEAVDVRPTDDLSGLREEVRQLGQSLDAVLGS